MFFLPVGALCRSIVSCESHMAITPCSACCACHRVLFIEPVVLCCDGYGTDQRLAKSDRRMVQDQCQNKHAGSFSGSISLWAETVEIRVSDDRPMESPAAAGSSGESEKSAGVYCLISNDWLTIATPQRRPNIKKRCWKGRRDIPKPPSLEVKALSFRGKTGWRLPPGRFAPILKKSARKLLSCEKIRRNDFKD